MVQAKKGDTVKVHYTGSLKDGTVQCGRGKELFESFICQLIRGSDRIQAFLKFHLFTLVILSALFLFSGCVAPIALHRAVIAYDRSVIRIESELLLLNIARARYNHPIHFTAVSSIAATFNFEAHTSIAGFFSESPGLAFKSLSPSFGGSASENPTVNIIPVQGEDFTKRILTPMNESKLEFLVQQGIEPAIILRLMARGILLTGYGESRGLLNMPHRKEEYKEFRRIVLHLSSLALARQLYMGSIRFADESERVVITNYNPMTISNDERKQLHEEVQDYPPNHVLVDISPDHPGGSYPLRGMIKLRSFKAILGFLGRSIDRETEFHVEKDPRTGPILRNPAKTMNVRVSVFHPRDATSSVKHNGRWYWIKNAPLEHDSVLPSWDHEAFDVLYQLFQMTVTDVARVPVPGITIAK